jgi:hypothetical protein
MQGRISAHGRRSSDDTSHQKDVELFRMSKAGRIIAIGFLFLSGGGGIQSAVSDWSVAATGGQILSTICAGLMGFLGVGAGVGAISRRAWVRPVVVAWGACVALVSGLAPVVWGGSSIATGIASGALGALLAALVYLGVQSGE